MTIRQAERICDSIDAVAHVLKGAVRAHALRQWKPFIIRTAANIVMNARRAKFAR